MKKNVRKFNFFALDLVSVLSGDVIKEPEVEGKKRTRAQFKDLKGFAFGEWERIERIEKEYREQGKRRSINKHNANARQLHPKLPRGTGRIAHISNKEGVKRKKSWRAQVLLLAPDDDARNHKFVCSYHSIGTFATWKEAFKAIKDYWMSDNYIKRYEVYSAWFVPLCIKNINDGKWEIERLHGYETEDNEKMQKRLYIMGAYNVARVYEDALKEVEALLKE